MICIKCGKKIEYEMPACKYCKEPIVLEGTSPMGDISALAPKAAACDAPSPVKYEMPMHRPAYEPKGSGIKKFIPLIVGGACAMVLLLLAVVINLPAEKPKEEPKPDIVTPAPKPKTPSDVYEDILAKATKVVEDKLSEGGNNPGGEVPPQDEELPLRIKDVIPYPSVK